MMYSLLAFGQYMLHRGFGAACLLEGQGGAAEGAGQPALHGVHQVGQLTSKICSLAPLPAGWSHLVQRPLHPAQITCAHTNRFHSKLYSRRCLYNGLMMTHAQITCAHAKKAHRKLCSYTDLHNGLMMTQKQMLDPAHMTCALTKVHTYSASYIAICVCTMAW